MQSLTCIWIPKIIFSYWNIITLSYFTIFSVGCLATVGALSFGLVSFKRGNMLMSQNMMRLRVVAQGGTVLALIGGIAIASSKQSKQ